VSSGFEVHGDLVLIDSLKNEGEDGVLRYTRVRWDSLNALMELRMKDGCCREVLPGRC